MREAVLDVFGEGLAALAEGAAGLEHEAAGLARGDALLERRHGRPLLDARPARRDDVFHDVPDVLRLAPARRDRHHVPLPHRVRRVVHQLVPRRFEVLSAWEGR